MHITRDTCWSCYLARSNVYYHINSLNDIIDGYGFADNLKKYFSPAYVDTIKFSAQKGKFHKILFINASPNYFFDDLIQSSLQPWLNRSLASILMINSNWDVGSSKYEQ